MPTLVSTGQITIVDVNDSPITNLTPPSELTSVAASPMGGWTLYSGTVSNSSIVNDQVGPNGEYPRILRLAGDGVSIAGWYSGYRYWFKVDITKAYVHYCWIRRRSATSANLYLGWTNTANYIDNLAGVNDSNPYFISGHNPTIADKWYLCVGVIWPAGYGAGDTGLAGMYDPHTGVRVYDGAEWRHNVAATQQYIRFGFYNNVTAQATTDGYDFLPVGTYCMDGTHPTKEAIMNTVPAAMTAALSKETYVFPADNVGAVSSYSGSGTQIRVYQGAAELTYDGVGTAKGTWRISSTTPTNITVGSITDSGTFATVADHSGVAAGTDTSTIVYNIAGKTLTGADFTLVKTQTFAKAKAGTNGTNGVRTAVLEMYQWAASAPSSFPSGSSTYTWSNGTFTAPATTNGWTLTPGTPSAGQTLYVVRQVFTDSLTSATSSVTWSASSSLPSGAAGTNGTNGQRVGVLEVYQWAVSAPTLYPTGTSTYTWSNGSFTAPSTPNGWSLTPGSPAVGQTLWAISTRVSDNLTSSTSTATWSSTSPYAVGYAGTNGTNGIAGERGSKEFFATGSAWSDATADSAITVAGLTKVLLDQVTISNGTSFAESRFWNGTAWTAISQVINGNLLVNGTVGANALVAGTILANVFNVGDTKFKLDGAAKGAGKGALIVTNGTNDILTLGYLDGTNIGLSLKDASGNVVMQTSTPAGGGATANSFSPSISNNAITVDASGILQGAGTANVVVANNQIAVNASGQVTGIGTGNNTTVANSQIAVNASGQVTGIGTGNNTTVANNQIAVNASGQVTGIGTGNNTTVANSQITISSGTINGIGTGNGTAVANDSVRGGGVNLVGNSGFLKNNGTLPTNWGIYNNGAISVTSTVQSGGLFGQNYIRITSNASTTASLGIYVSNNADSVKSWEPGQLYCISFWAKGSGGMLGQTMYGFYSNMGFTGVVILENPVVTGSWQRYVFRGTPNNNANTPNGELFISWLVSGTLASGSVLDITCPKVELGSQPTSWTPSPQDTLNQNISISSGAIQGIGSGTGTMVSNNAITVDVNGILQGTGTANTVVANNKVTISNGTISGIGTGNGTAVDNQYTIIGQNLLPNSDCARSHSWQIQYNPNGANITEGPSFAEGANGWDTTNYVLAGTETNNLYVKQDGIATGTADGSGDNAVACDIYPYENGTLISIPAIAGEVFMASAYIGNHRCVGSVFLGFFSSSGTALQYNESTSVGPTSGNTNTLSLYNRAYIKATAPANTAYVRLFVRKRNTLAGNTTSFMWWTAPQLERVNSGVSLPSPYQPGPPSSTRQLGYSGELNATYGAVAGTNLRDSGGSTLSDSAIKNASITIDGSGIIQNIGTGSIVVANNKVTINSNGTLSGAGAGQVTIGGLGYTGDLNATSGGGVIPNSSSFASGWTIGANVTLTTGGSGDPAPKYLRSTTVGGGNANTGLIDLPASATKLWFYYQRRSNLGTTAAGFVNGNIYYYRADGSFLTAVTTSTDYPTTTTWNGTYFLQEFTIPTGAAKIQMYVSLQPTSGNWVDVALPNIFTIQPGATVGAKAGTNLLDSSGASLGDSAIKNASITIDGSGIIQNIGTASTVVANSQVPVGQNLCINTDFVNGMTGWVAGWDGNIGGTITRGGNLPGWFGQINVLYATRVGTPTAGTVFDAFVNETTTSGVDGFKRYAIPVLPGERLYFSWLVAGHRCSTESKIGWYDSTGTYLTETGSTSIAENGGASGGDPTTMARSGGFGTAPANARYARIWVRGVATGAADPYIFCAQPFVTKVPSNQTAVPPYSSGPADRAATLGATIGTNLSGTFNETEFNNRFTTNTISGTYIKDATISNAKIENLAVTNAKIANATIETAKIADLAVTNAKLANATITSAKIGDLEVTNAKIANLTVGTQKITDLAISRSSSSFYNFAGWSYPTDFTWYDVVATVNTYVYVGVNQGSYDFEFVQTNTPYYGMGEYQYVYKGPGQGDYNFVSVSSGLITSVLTGSSVESGSQVVNIEAVVAIERDGGSDDNVGARVIRTNDSVVLPETYSTLRARSGKSTYALMFRDPSPIAGTTNTYKVQMYNNNDNSHIYEAGMRATLFRK